MIQIRDRLVLAGFGGLWLFLVVMLPATFFRVLLPFILGFTAAIMVIIVAAVRKHCGMVPVPINSKFVLFIANSRLYRGRILILQVYMVLGATTLGSATHDLDVKTEHIPEADAPGALSEREIQQLMGNIGLELSQVCSALEFPGCRSHSAYTNMGSIAKMVLVLQAPVADIPPYPMWKKGAYEGWIWTLETSRFDRSQVCALLMHMYASWSKGSY
jgi:hypothetical protein